MESPELTSNSYIDAFSKTLSRIQAGEDEKTNSADSDADSLAEKLPEKKTEGVEREERGEWDNAFQFMLTALGMAVGLGNLWRFPALAYENGGGAFVLAYIVCLIAFGLPMVYLEFFIGQYTKSGPALVFKHYAPAFHGIGWAAAIVSVSLCLYYIIIVAWCFLYLLGVAETATWITCSNWWNTENCIWENETISQCNWKGEKYFKINGTGDCYNRTGKSSSEEYFEYKILQMQKEYDFWNFGDLHWALAATFVGCWLFVWLTLCKGIKIIGMVSYVTTPLPYVLIIVLLINGLMLDGSAEGYQFLLSGSDWERLIYPQVWREAITQMCFSLAIGYGALIAMASYNKKQHNCFRDALVVVIGDTAMSIIGSFAVFSTLGFLARQTNQKLGDVVKNGAALAFVIYPQALARMSLPWMWSTLFFIMLMILGITTVIGLVEAFCTSVYDQWPSTRNKKWLVSLGICALLMVLGFPMCFQNGMLIFTLFDEFGGSTGTCFVCAMEAFAVAWFYGPRNVMKDIHEAFGQPQSVFGKFLMGPRSYWWAVNWMTFSPLFALLIMVFTLIRGQTKYNNYVLPIEAEVIGWIFAFLPLIPIIPFFIINVRKSKSFGEVFKVAETHPSFSRISETKLADPNEVSIEGSLSRTRSRHTE